MPESEFFVVVGFLENRGRISEKGRIVNGVGSAPLWAKCFQLHSRRDWNDLLESVISIWESDLGIVTRSNNPALDPLTIVVRCHKASHLISLLRIALNSFCALQSFEVCASFNFCLRKQKQ